MKAVWTILGWCTAAAAAAGAGIATGFVVCCCSAFGVLLLCSPAPSFAPLLAVRPLRSLSGLLFADWGAEALVGVDMSIGSPGDGADI